MEISVKMKDILVFSFEFGIMKTIWIEIYTTRGVKLLGNKSHQFNWIPKCMNHVLVI